LKIFLIAASLAAALLGGCASLPAPGAGAAASVAGSPWAAAAGQQRRPGSWEHYALPGKRAVEFHYVRNEGRDAVAATSVSAASMMRKKLRIEPEELGHVRFSWKVPELIAQADLALRDKADSPVRIVLAFEGDRSRFSARNAAMAELALALTGEQMPYATLMYVWCNLRQPGAVIRSSRTDRVRKLCVESGAANLGRWLDYERDIRADFERAFGEPPGALVGIAIMTDSDNTGTRTRAWYGPARLVPVASSPPPAAR
jgi:hypothetical protein